MLFPSLPSFLKPLICPLQTKILSPKKALLRTIRCHVCPAVVQTFARGRPPSPRLPARECGGLQGNSLWEDYGKSPMKELSDVEVALLPYIMVKIRGLHHEQPRPAPFYKTLQSRSIAMAKSNRETRNEFTGWSFHGPTENVCY